MFNGLILNDIFKRELIMQSVPQESVLSLEEQSLTIRNLTVEKALEILKNMSGHNLKHKIIRCLSVWSYFFSLSDRCINKFKINIMMTILKEIPTLNNLVLLACLDGHGRVFLLKEKMLQWLDKNLRPFLETKILDPVMRTNVFVQYQSLILSHVFRPVPFGEIPDQTTYENYIKSRFLIVMSDFKSLFTDDSLYSVDALSIREKLRILNVELAKPEAERHNEYYYYKSLFENDHFIEQIMMNYIALLYDNHAYFRYNRVGLGVVTALHRQAWIEELLLDCSEVNKGLLEYLVNRMFAKLNDIITCSGMKEYSARKTSSNIKRVSWSPELSEVVSVSESSSSSDLVAGGASTEETKSRRKRCRENSSDCSNKKSCFYLGIQ